MIDRLKIKQKLCEDISTSFSTRGRVLQDYFYNFAKEMTDVMVDAFEKELEEFKESFEHAKAPVGRPRKETVLSKETN